MGIFEVRMKHYFSHLDITPLVEDFLEWKRKRQASRKELVKALKDLSDRHEWHPDVGSCICEPHKRAQAILKKEKL